MVDMEYLRIAALCANIAAFSASIWVLQSLLQYAHGVLRFAFLFVPMGQGLNIFAVLLGWNAVYHTLGEISVGVGIVLTTIWMGSTLCRTAWQRLVIHGQK